MYSICQRCGGDQNHHWNVKAAEFHVGRIERWKVQLCESCTTALEQAILQGGCVRLVSARPARS